MANGRACSSADAPVDWIVHGLLQNQNLGRLGDLVLLHFVAALTNAESKNILGKFLLWLSTLLARTQTFLSRWPCEARKYHVVMAAKRALFTHSLFSVVTAHQFSFANHPRVSN